MEELRNLLESWISNPNIVDKTMEMVSQELDKAREEGFRNCYKEVLAMDSFGERMDMSRKESFRRLKNLLEDKIRLKLTTK